MTSIAKAAATQRTEPVAVPAPTCPGSTNAAQEYIMLSRIAAAARTAVQDTRGKVRRAFLEIIDIAEGRK